jgi:hypothetical protein
MKATPKTYWFAMLRYNGGRSASSCGGSTLAEAVAHVAESYAYYSIACGYPDLVAEIEQVCIVCDGNGKVTAKKRGTVKTCPNCRGKALGEKHVVTWKPMTETTLCRLRDQVRAERSGAAC